MECKKTYRTRDPKTGAIAVGFQQKDGVKFSVHMLPMLSQNGPDIKLIVENPPEERRTYQLRDSAEKIFDGIVKNAEIGGLQTALEGVSWED